MESLSPLVRSGSVRRLSLDLAQKLASNLFSSPVGNKVACSSKNGRRRASVDFQLQPFAKKSITPETNNNAFRRASVNLSTISPFSSLINCNKSVSREPASPGNAFLSDDEKEEDYARAGKRPRRSSLLSSPTSTLFGINVIPPTPKRRNSSDSNKENDNDVENASVDGKRRSSTSLDADLVSAAKLLHGVALKTKVLGRGSFGIVYSGKYKGAEIAVKVLKKGSLHLTGELHALSLPFHPHVVAVLDILRIPSSSVADQALVLLEKIDKGNLLFLLNDPDIKINTKLASEISSQIASALSFCHRHKILHLDVKPQNVLVHKWTEQELLVKLSDFGNSKTKMDIEISKDFRKLDGTVAYKAPELFRGNKPTERCDVYSLGITMWQILYREQPYIGESEHSVIYKVVAQNLRPKAVCFFLQTTQDIGRDAYIKIFETAWNGDPDHRQSMHFLHHQLVRLQRSL